MLKKLDADDRRSGEKILFRKGIVSTKGDSDFRISVGPCKGEGVVTGGNGNLNSMTRK
jgi:hypothetical protein